LTQNKRRKIVKKQILLLAVVTAVVVASIIGYNFFKTPDEASTAIDDPVVAETISEEVSATNGTVYTIDTANSEARFIIQEILRNVDTTVVGTTDQVSGQIALDSSAAQTAEISEILINARTIATDQNMRNRAIGNQILLTNQYEFISFVPTQIVGLPDTVEVGQSYNFQIVGDLTIIGQTREVTFDTQATLVSDNELTGLATTTLNHDDFGITIPFSQSVQAVADEVTLELQFAAKAG
jgi:polyisoprenoid-binding protein YceI